jgi:hypothetical protein
MTKKPVINLVCIVKRTAELLHKIKPSEIIDLEPLPVKQDRSRTNSSAQTRFKFSEQPVFSGDGVRRNNNVQSRSKPDGLPGRRRIIRRLEQFHVHYRARWLSTPLKFHK